MQGLANAFGMDDAVWRQHANPWSVYTRAPILPALAVAIYARVWIGAWCLVPVALILAWTWINPRAFPVPDSTDHWASKAVMGERVWLNAARFPIPAHHRRAIWILQLATVPGLVAMVWGLVVLDFSAAFLGSLLAAVPKLWFLDRMVWLYDDMAAEHPHYRDWLR